MATLNLTIQVLDLSPRVTFTDLNIFFSYCGTVYDIKLERKEDQSQVALVSFRQPYALQTALLLNGAVIVDRQVRILRASPAVSDSINSEIKKNEKRGPGQAVASKGYEALNKAKKEADEKHKKLSEKGRMLTLQTRMAIPTGEQTAECIGEMIMSNQYFSAGAFWVSDVLDKAAKRAAELGSHNKEREPKSRNHK